MERRILFVEDDQAIADLARAALEGAGYKITHAINGDVAKIVLEQGVQFDLMITDIVLPGMVDGFGLAHQARGFLPRLKIIYSTGYAGVARVRSQGAPYGDMLAKPWKIDHLLEVVRTALADGDGRNRQQAGLCVS
jgi:DNA-binding NtrC family response regulator